MNEKTNTLIKQHTYFNKKFFAIWAPLYDYEKYLLFPLRNAAAKLLKLQLSSRVIDVATGTGAQAYALAKLGYDVTGIDLSEEMLREAKKKQTIGLKLKFLHADATRIPFLKNSFDAASISLGLHDMPYPIRILVLNEIKRVTRPNGNILIIDYLEPDKNIIASILNRLVGPFETPMQKDFVTKGLAMHLNATGLSPIITKRFLQAVQIVLCKNKN